MTPTLTASGSRRELPPVETGLAPSPDSTTIARRNISGKPRLDPADLVCHRRSHRAAGIKAGILQEQNSVSLLAHASHGFFRHVRRYGRVHLATDYKERAPGSLLSRSVPGEKFPYEPIVLPIPSEHFAGELRLRLSS